MTPISVEKARELMAQATLSKRALVVMERILDRGYVTTKELQEEFGYDQPPRAARDVREAGIPLKTKMVREGGKRMARYELGDVEVGSRRELTGRKQFPKQVREALYAIQDGRCEICSGAYPIRYQQVDHRVPYEVGGEVELDLDNLQKDFLLLCASCNRSKSWSCEHCENFANTHDAEVCQSCYWADPLNYTHIAMEAERRMDLVFRGADEVTLFDQLLESGAEDIPPQIKLIQFLRDALED